ncbi:MAG: copper amine oxidase N-terminal domain-containing protein [Defluviitaleaceae bacterium]|nr:copper amine oxidase N-terminal domain-containing protein [Defluviitaleaceae bacterium]
MRIALLVAMLLLLFTFTVSAAKNDDITITIDGIAMEFPREQPVIRDGRVFVPNDFTFFSSFGFGFRPISYFALRYEPEAHKGLVQFNCHMHSYYFFPRVGDYEMLIQPIGRWDDYFTVQLDVAPFRYNDEELRVPMLPLRAIAEAAGFTVEWDGETRTVIITS